MIQRRIFNNILNFVHQLFPKQQPSSYILRVFSWNCYQVGLGDRVSAALNYGAAELATRMTTVTSPTMTETGQPRNGTGTMSQSEGDLLGRCFVISDLAAVVNRSLYSYP